MPVYITGSLAFDRIMNFPGRFTDNILPNQIHNLNVSFFIDRLDEKFGGTGGNIAYSLALLGEKPVIVANAGKDFGPYREHLEGLGMSMEGVFCLGDERTASAYITTDEQNNQITAFHAGAMMRPSPYDFPSLNPERDLAIIAPTNMRDMNEHPLMHKKAGIRYVYDPSQQLPMLGSEDLRNACDGAHLIMGNDYEVQLIMNRTGWSKNELAGRARLGLIATMGERGSLITANNGKETHVGIVEVAQAADPTGAGDAYRAGVLKGLIQGLSLEECARLGATSAAYCVECHGTQNHTYTQDEFYARHKAAWA